MKKKILIATGALVVILASLIIFVGFKANDLVAAYKPQIEEQLSKALGAKVTLNALSVSVFPSASIEVDDVQVSNPAGTKSSLSVGALKAAVSLSALLSKKLVVTELEVVKPAVTLIKESTGITVAGVPTQNGSTQPIAGTQTSPATSAPPPLNLNIDRILISNGAIVIDDRVARKTTSLKDLNLDAGIAIEGSVIQIPSSRLSFALGAKPPLSITGDGCAFDQSNGSLSIKSAKLATSAGEVTLNGSLNTTTQSGTLHVTAPGVDLAELATLVSDLSPALAQFKTSGVLGATLSLSLAGNTPIGVSGPLRLKAVSADIPGLQVRELTGEIKASGDVTNLSLATSGLGLKLNGSPLSVDTTTKLTPTSVSLSPLTVRGFGGEIKAPTTLGLASPQTFSTQPVVIGVTLPELLKAFQPAAANSVTGKIDRFEGSFNGTLGTELLNSLSGRGNLLLKDGALKNVNLPGLVLSKVSNIPLLEGTLIGYVAPEHRRYFEAKDTPIKRLSSEFQAQGGTVSIGSAEMQSDAFTLRSNGTVRLGGALNLSSSIAFAPDISASMAKRSKTIASMIPRDGMLTIPLLIQGTPPAVVVIPDVAKLAQGAGRQAIEQAAGKALQKVLGGGKGNDKQPLKGILGF